MRWNLNRWPIAVLLIMSFALLGCSDRSEDGRRVAGIQRALKQVERLVDQQDRIRLLRIIYDDAMSLNATWPDSSRVIEFLSEYESRLNAIPAQVYELALKSRDLRAYEWAVDRGIEMDLSHEALKQYWKYGRDWQFFFATTHPDEILPVFMVYAIRQHDIIFFRKYADAFKASGRKIDDSLDATDFNSRYCRFVAEQMNSAMKQSDVERLQFLIGHMPKHSDTVYIDDKTRELMRTLGTYVCYDLQNEELACALVELGYEFDRIEIKKTGFGSAFIEALKAHPEYAVLDVLQLDEWRGKISDEELDLVLSLDEDQLALLHLRHIDEVVEACSRRNLPEDAMRIVAFRMNIRPYTLFEYKELLKYSIRFGNKKLFDYVMEQCPEIDLQSLDVLTLASNHKMFMQYAPKIFRKIHRTMDNPASGDGVSFGQLFEVLTSKNHKASYWILDHTDIQAGWPEVNDGRTLLMDICEAGNLEVARYLIEEKYADISARTGLRKMNLSLFGQATSSSPADGNLSPIFFAAMSGNSDLIRYLVSKGANVNDRSTYGATPLMCAVTHSRLQAAQALIELHADVNAKMHGNPGWSLMQGRVSFEQVATAYLRAKYNGQTDMMDMLLQAGARP